MPSPTDKGKRLKTSAKVDKPAKEKQFAKTSKDKGLNVLSEVALTEAKQMKLATKRSLTQTHISHASKLCADEGTGIIPGVLDVPTYESDDEEISWKSSEDDNDDEVKINNNGDDFVHPKFSTHDEEDKDEEIFDPIVQTPSQVENTDDEDSHGMNVEGNKGANEEDDGNQLYRDVNINLEVNNSSSVSPRFVLNMLNPSPGTGIDSIFESTSRVDVPITTIDEPPLLSATTLPLPSIPIIAHVQQTPAPSPANVLSSSLQDFLILALCLDEAQAKNEDFLNKLDENIQKIIKEKVKEQVKTSYDVAADLSELEPKKILIDKIESNKSIHRSDEQKNLYKALVDDYECDKLILDTYGDTVTLKRQETMHTAQDLEEPAPQEFETGSTDVQPVKEASQHPQWFQKKVKPTPSDRAWNKTLPTTHGWNLALGCKRQQFYGFEVNREFARDVYSKRRIIAITELQIVEWHNYKHLDWLTVRRDDDKLYKFKEGDFKRHRIQDIEDMLLLLVQGS
uniref:Uncharacterized protein n=1 Tax=Tanacetum cinerariifolium TaxID=118510 RepID=A0A6L2JJ21_TANCI|nr:hypothetical protein [Tanacetum cinerariifolium]